MKTLSRNIVQGALAIAPPPLQTGVLHFGLGAFHRGHQAYFFDRVLAGGVRNWGVAAVNLRSSSIVRALKGQDNLFCRWERGADSDSISVIASLRASYHLPTERAAVMALFCRPEVKLITISVSEKGYHYDSQAKGLDMDDAEIVADIARPGLAATMPGVLAAGLEARRLAGAGPVTIISCDNYQDNGQVLRSVVNAMAQKCHANLLPWLETHVRFPASMVDGIVPVVREQDRAALARRIGINDPAMVIAEDYMRWVIKDDFAAGRPLLEEVGVEIVTDVAPYEAMKLHLMNAPHSALAYLGHNAGFEYVHEALADPRLRAFLERLIGEELLPVFEQKNALMGGRDYAKLTLKRFANPNIAYRTGQVATDGSLKIPQRLLPVAAQLLSEGKIPDGIAIVLAAWVRFLSGVNETGEHYMISDPLAGRFAACYRASGGNAQKLVESLLSISAIFPAIFAGHRQFKQRIVSHLKGFANSGTLPWLETMAPRKT